MDSPSKLKNNYQYWEITKDLIDQCIDITLNLSQSGHPGGSRSKVHGMLITLLSGAMRWDIREFLELLPHALEIHLKEYAIFLQIPYLSLEYSGANLVLYCLIQ